MTTPDNDKPAEPECHSPNPCPVRELFGVCLICDKISIVIYIAPQTGNESNVPNPRKSDES